MLFGRLLRGVRSSPGVVFSTRMKMAVKYFLTVLEWVELQAWRQEQKSVLGWGSDGQAHRGGNSFINSKSRESFSTAVRLGEAYGIKV